MRKTVISTITAVMFAASLAPVALAEPTPEDAAKYRQYVMRALSGHFGAATLTTRGLAGNSANIRLHSAAVVALAAEITPAFAAAGGAPVEDTEALPEIWDHPEGFAAAVETFSAAAAAFDAAVAGGDASAAAAAHRGVADACKGCHEDYRLDD